MIATASNRLTKVGLDQSIIGPALPTIAAQFNSLHDIGSYASAYLLPQCILHVICNDVYSIFTFANVYLSSVLIFGGEYHPLLPVSRALTDDCSAGCLVSATSTSSAALIGGRCIAGVGATGLATGGFRLLALLPESKQQNLSMGAFSLILGIHLPHNTSVPMLTATRIIHCSRTNSWRRHHRLVKLALDLLDKPPRHGPRVGVCRALHASRRS